MIIDNSDNNGKGHSFTYRLTGRISKCVIKFKSCKLNISVICTIFKDSTKMSLSSLTMKASDLVFRCVKPYCYYLPDYFPDLTIDMDKETEERMLQYLGESPLQRANLWDSIASIKKTPNLNPKLVSAIENFEGVLLQPLKVLPETDQLLYELFCFIYVSEGQADGTRTLFRVFDDITNISKQYTNISSGSAAEGLRIAKGDYDVMTVLNLVTVDNKVFPSIGEKPMLWYDASCSNPGFVKIEIAEGPYKEEILSNWGVYHENRPLLSNSKFKNYFERNYRLNDTKIHGPCISSLREHDGVDHLFCLKCKTRLDLVKTWVSRAKSHDGLDDTIIARVANKDVLLAPVGDNYSSESVYPFQWRLSLSLLEKELVHSWSHLQFLCYYIIKYLIKIMTKDIPAKIICSFFIKNALFWLGEETHESFWRECHLFECIDVVMNRLSWWYTQGYCPHYFVPENNLFKGIESCYLPIAADLTSKWSLMVKNRTNIALGFTSVEFFYFERYLTEDTYFQEKMIAILFNMKFLRNTLQVSTFMQCNAMLKKSLHRCLHFRPSYYKKGVYLAMFCFANQAYCDKLPYNTSTNKKCYMYYKDIISHLLIGKNADVISGWSLLAMFFSHWQAYENCIEVINFIVEKCSKNFNSLNCFTDYVRMLQDFFDSGKKLLNKSKSFLFHMNTCIDVLHFDRTSPWFPQELLTNEAKDFDFHRMLPVIFGHFLTFIIALRQTNSFQAEIAVANIVVENRENKIHGYYAEKLSTYIILVICYSLLKDKQAADYWRQHVHRYAQKIRKY